MARTLPAAVRAALPLAVCLLAAPAALPAQVVQTPDGPVEFIGLERWTIPMIRDSMAVHAPGEPLGQCAAVLTQLGFVSAVASQRPTEEGGWRTVVTVVEPHRAGRIRLRPPAADSLPDLAEWREGIRLLVGESQAFQAAIQWRDVQRHPDPAHVEAFLQPEGERAEPIRAVWDFLERHAGAADLERALEVLAHDGNRRNTAVAAAILTNFPDEPRAWWALADAQRDARPAVAGTASQAMSGLRAGWPRSIDWRPAAPALRALLDGTNVFVLERLLETLTHTRIDPALGRELLADGGADLVLARLRARDEHTRGIAHAFLVQATGTDHGEDADAWAASLRR